MTQDNLPNEEFEDLRRFFEAAVKVVFDCTPDDLPTAVKDMPAADLEYRARVILDTFSPQIENLLGYRPDHHSARAIPVIRFLLDRFGVKLTYKRARVGETLTYLYSVDVSRWEQWRTYAASRQQERDERLQQRQAEKAAQRQTRNRAGYVYVARGEYGGQIAYKIGRSVNPKSRAKTFGVELPFTVEFVALIQTEDMYALESELHRYYDQQGKWLTGEWFNLEVNDIEYIKSLDNQAKQEMN